MGAQILVYVDICCCWQFNQTTFVMVQLAQRKPKLYIYRTIHSCVHVLSEAD